MRIGVAHSMCGGPGGIEKANHALYEAIEARGHSVELVCATIAEELSESCVHRVNTPRWPGFFRLLSFNRKAGRILKSLGVNVSHSHGEVEGCDVITAHSCHRRGMRVMESQRGRLSILDRSAGFSDRVRLRLEERIYTERRYRKIIAISDRVKSELMAEYSIPQEDIRVIHHAPTLQAVDESEKQIRRAMLRSRLEFTESDFVILFLSNEPVRKGLETVCRSMAALREGGARLLVVGPDLSGRFQSLATSLGIGDQTTFVGRQALVDDYYYASDLFVLPTLYEPYGLVITEAMAAGLPILVSRESGAAAHCINHNASDILIDDPLSLDEVVAKMSSLISNKDLPSSMAAKVHEEAINRTWDECASQVIAVYQEVLDAH